MHQLSLPACDDDRCNRPDGSRSRPAEATPAPMRGLKTDHGARIIAGHAFIQNIRRGYYHLGVDEAATLRVAAAFDELVLAI
jgi:hypothetical protein